MVGLDSEIIIVGGGPVGVGLAIDLAQRGHDVLVVEKYSRPQLVPKGQNLTSRTMEHLAAWGADQIARSKRPTSRSTGNGGLNCYKTLLSGYHYGWLNRESVRSFYYEDVERLPQYVTEDALRERASELQNIRWMSNHEAISCSTEDSLATVRVRDRETDSVQELRARFLVGCDGSHSVIRRSASITQTMNDHDRKMAL
ncbi:MAG: FAD-dependent oxidoreductase, partial [Gammaproteobacteria bacterium]